MSTCSKNLSHVFELYVDCDNAEFTCNGEYHNGEANAVSSNSASFELARILRNAADKIELGAQFFNATQPIRDSNGTLVGGFVLKIKQ